MLCGARAVVDSRSFRVASPPWLELIGRGWLEAVVTSRNLLLILGASDPQKINETPAVAVLEVEASGGN